MRNLSLVRKEVHVEMTEAEIEYYEKLVFYSVISNYRTAYSLGLIKKTRTVSGTDVLTGWKKLSNVLAVGSDLFSKDFEFVTDIVLIVGDPVLYVLLWFCK